MDKSANVCWSSLTSNNSNISTFFKKSTVVSSIKISDLSIPEKAASISSRPNCFILDANKSRKLFSDGITPQPCAEPRKTALFILSCQFNFKL